MGFSGTFRMPPGRLDFWCSMGKNDRPPPPTPKLKVREVSQLMFQVSARSVDHNFWPLETQSETLRWCIQQKHVQL